jgi:LysM repeat protein/GH24 family phage-related lysozyme (muramidase)
MESVYTPEFLEKIMRWENSIKSGWNEQKKRWYPHPSPEGGLKTIAYGHKCKTAQEQNDFEQKGLSETEAVALLKADLESAAKKAQALVPKFPALPDTVKQALTNAAFRGEIKSTHRTIELMNANNWSEAAKEYLNNKDYKEHPGVQKRMNWNYEQFLNLAKGITTDKSKNKDNSANNSQLIGKTVYPIKKNGFANVRSETYVDNGIIDNLISKINYPKPIGYIKQVVKGKDGGKWYQVVLANKEMGYVKSDVVTTTNESQYEVQQGDTLTKIAKDHNTTVDAILKKNPGLEPSSLQIGQKIKI